MTLAIEESLSLDNLTKPAPIAGGSESNSEQNLRSNPVCLEVVVTIRSLPGEKDEASSGPAKPTWEEARTVIVFDNGAVLRLASHFPVGQAVILSNSQGRDVVCRVVSTRDLPTVKGYMEVEFLEPMADFWGIHKPVGQSNASAPSVAVVAEPPAATQPQVVSSEPPLAPPPAPAVAAALAPPIAPPAPVHVAPPMPETVAPAGNAPSFEDIAGLMQMSPPAIARGKAPESTPRIPVSRKSEESVHQTVEVARPFSPVSAAGPASELASLSTTWDGAPAPARTPFTHNDTLGKFSPPYTASESSVSESRGKTPLIVVGAAVFLIGLGAGLFFMRQRSSTAPAVVPVTSASQPTKPAPRPSTSVPTPAVIPQSAAEQAPPLSPAISPATSVPKEIVAALEPASTPAIRHQANPAIAKQPDQVEANQPDQSSQRPQVARDLKMVAPTVESRTGRLVDGSVPDIEVASATRPASGTPGGDLIPPVSQIGNPFAPPDVIARPSSSGKSVMEAKLISSTRPVYPPQARQSNIEGDVLVAAEIDATGRVIGAKATAGPVLLRQAAIDAVRNWKYDPAKIDGRPSSAQITIRIQFRLK
jgi:protein TonB